MFYKYNAPAFYWAGVIIILTLSPWLPSFPVGKWNFSGIDLLAHALFFGVQSYLLSRGFEKQDKYPLYRKFYPSLAMTYTTLFGIFIEILQYYHPTRYFEYFDILANVIGSILGFTVYRLLKNTRYQF